MESATSTGFFFFWNLTRIRLCLTHWLITPANDNWKTKTKTKIEFKVYGATIIINIFGVLNPALHFCRRHDHTDYIILGRIGTG